MGVRKRVPVSDPAVRVEFTLTDPSYPFVHASAAADCNVLLEEFVPREGGRYAEFFSVTGVDPDRFHDIATDHPEVDVNRLTAYDDGGLYEFVVGDYCPAVALGKCGALPRDLTAVDGEGRVVGEVPPTEDATDVVGDFLDDHPDADLAAKHPQPFVTPLFSHREFGHALGEALTDRQREILAEAHDAGFYESPRETAGDEIADRLGITPPTFHQHLRAAERKLVTLFFEEPGD